MNLEAKLAAPRAWARSMRRRHFAATVMLAIFAGLAGMIVITTVEIGRRTESSVDRFEAAVPAADTYVYACPVGVTQAQLQRADFDPSQCFGDHDTARISRQIAGSPLVVASGRSGQFPVAVRRAGDSRWHGEIDLAPLDRGPGVVTTPLMVSGRMPDPGRADEVAVNEVGAAHGITVGSTIDLALFRAAQIGSASLTGAVPKGETSRVRVVGMFRSRDDLPAGGQGPRIITSPAWWVRHRTDDVANYGTFTAVELRHGASDLRPFRISLHRLLPGRYSFLESDYIDLTPVRRVVSLQADAAFVMAAVAAVAAILFVGQSLSRQVTEDFDESPTLVGLGMTRSDLLVTALLRTGPVAAGAAMIAGLGAYLASGIGPVGEAQLAEVEPGLRFDALVVSGGAVVVAAFVLAVAVHASGRRPGSASGRATRNVSRNATSYPPLPVRIGLMLLSFRRSASRVALVGVVAAVGLAVAAGSLLGSLSSLDAHPKRFGQTWSLVAGDFTDRPSVVAALKKVRRLPGVRAASAITEDNVNIDHLNLEAMAFAPGGGPIRPVLTKGRAPTSRHEIALGARTMTALHAHLGDTVQLARGSTTKGAGAMTVVGVGVINDAQTATLSPDAGAILDNSTMQSISQVVAENVIVLPVPGHESEVRTALERSFGDTVKVASPPDDVSNLGRISAAPTLVAVLVALLALATLLHCLVSSVRRGRHQISVLRAIGMSPRQNVAGVGSMSPLVAVTGSIIGVPIGLLAANQLWRVALEPSGVTSPLSLAPGRVVLILGVALVAAVAASIVPEIDAARIDTVAALRAGHE